MSHDDPPPGMNVLRRLTQIVRVMPEGSSVLLQVDWLRAQLEAADDGSNVVESVAGLTVGQVAKALNRSPSTVRAWCAAEKIPGCRRLNGREYRIPRKGLREFLDGQADGTSPEPVRGHQADLGEWRKHLRNVE